MLQSRGLQTVRHDLVTKQQQQFCKVSIIFILQIKKLRSRKLGKFAPISYIKKEQSSEWKSGCLDLNSGYCLRR